jgi:hypothetical protein
VSTPAAPPNMMDGNPAITLPGIPTTLGLDVDVDAVVGQMVRRASSPGFDDWWRRAESVGFCAYPIQLTGTDTYGRQQIVWTRCNNRRAQVCPSCSDVYARDTWQLVHAGAAGGHHNIPATISDHPQVFVTLTAPGFGPVHNATGDTCRDHHRIGGYTRCPHGTPLWCSQIHERTDQIIGQPFCGQCYDYLAHVLFIWHLPELWRRFTIALRRAVGKSLKAVGIPSDTVRVGFVKVVEMQARAVAHIHALIRLDPTNDTDTTASDEHASHGPAAPRGGGELRHAAQSPWQPTITAADLAALIDRTARRITITVPTPTIPADDPSATGAGDAGVATVRFGSQIDTQPLTTESSAAQDDSDAAASGGLSARRVARYLAKYVTKSLHDFGIAARRLSTEAIATLDVTEHIRSILFAIAALDDHATRDTHSPWAGIGRWLHTLGYRGHITTKSRRYSTTMTALRAHRARWTRDHTTTAVDGHQDRSLDGEGIGWEFDRAGHTAIGDRVLAVSASRRHIAARRTGLVEAHGQARDQQSDPPGARDD